MGSNIHLAICWERKDIQTLEKWDFFIKEDSGPEQLTGSSSSKHVALFTDVNVVYTVFASSKVRCSMIVYTVKFCFFKEK